MGSSAIARWRPINSSCASPEAPPCTVTVAIESSWSRRETRRAPGSPGRAERRGGWGAISGPPMFSSVENALPAAVLAGGLHEPLHAVGVGTRRQLARGREHEARARAGGVDAAPHLRLDLRLRRALEHRHVHVADGHHVPLVAERDEAAQLVDVERRAGPLAAGHGGGCETHAHQAPAGPIPLAADAAAPPRLPCPA